MATGGGPDVGGVDHHVAAASAPGRAAAPAGVVQFPWNTVVRLTLYPFGSASTRVKLSLRGTKMSTDQIVQEIMSTACDRAGRATATYWGSHWMKSLAKGFRSKYPEEDVIVHANGDARSVVIGSVRKKEMLFDILVAGWDQNAIRATHGSTYYPRLKPPIWAVESEVDTGAAQVLYDFNKLLLAGVPNRLLITKNRRSNFEFTDFLRDAASGHDRGGDIHVAYVPSFEESKTKSKQASPE